MKRIFTATLAIFLSVAPVINAEECAKKSKTNEKIKEKFSLSLLPDINFDLPEDLKINLFSPQSNQSAGQDIKDNIKVECNIVWKCEPKIEIVPENKIAEYWIDPNLKISSPNDK